jgi:hypothetical protein
MPLRELLFGHVDIALIGLAAERRLARVMIMV